MPADDRDQQFERALARHLSNASPYSACPDAEVLSAYQEHTLSLDESARWKEHIAGCARCQEILSLVAQTENLPAEEGERQKRLQPAEQLAVAQAMRAAHAMPPQTEQVPSAPPMVEAIAAPVSEPSRRPPWRWMVPVGALAAGVVLWIGIHEVRTQHLQQLNEAQMARNTSAIPQLPSHQSQSAERLGKEAPPGDKLGTESPTRKALTSPSPGVTPSQEAEAPKVAGVPSSSANDLTTSKQKDSLPAIVGGRIAPAPAPSAVSGFAAKSRSTETLTRPQANEPAIPWAASPSAQKKEESKRIAPSASETLEVQPAAPALNSTSAQVLARESGDVASLMQLATGNARYIVAPGEKPAWRLGDAGKIERSTDRGKTWKLLKSGATADLTAGSATSDKVCWVVGKAGTLLLTTDGGKHWKRLSSPITEDLGGIHATDAAHASIWDVPNRRSFETSDGGATWQSTANK